VPVDDWQAAKREYDEAQKLAAIEAAEMLKQRQAVGEPIVVASWQLNFARRRLRRRTVHGVARQP
jgi:hypothetical protein